MDDESSQREPSVAREIALGVGRAALLSNMVRDAIGGALLTALMVVFVPLGLLYLAVAAVGWFLVASLVQDVLGLEAIVGVVGVGWWIAAFVLMFLLFRRVYRWLARRATAIGAATDAAFSGRTELSPEPETTSWADPVVANVVAPEPLPSLAELDARLAPPTPARDRDP